MPTSLQTPSTINVTVDFEGTEDRRLRAIESAASALLAEIYAASPNNVVWSLRETVWPSLEELERRDVAMPPHVRLSLSPLSRIGQMEGKSGSLVLIGQFESDAISPSHPLVVKTRLRDGIGQSLETEWRKASAIKPFIYDRKDSFAIPLRFHSNQHGYDVLWSSCMLSARTNENPDVIDESAHPALFVKDLRSALGVPGLRGASAEQPLVVEESLLNVYRLLRNIHRGFKVAEHAARDERLIVKEYEWYLRGYSPSASPGSVWGPLWAEFWAPPSQQTCGLNGTTNPLWVVDRLSTFNVPMRVAAIHGDLHAGNIILRDHDYPAIIDFGWSHESAHIAKDFVLMECNLRFLTLRPQINDDDLDHFATWVGPRRALSTNMSAYLADRARLIDVVRSQARLVLGDDADWDREYMIPLFLVAFGLLRFAPQLGHQRAAIRFVEEMAHYLADTLRL